MRGKNTSAHSAELLRQAETKTIGEFLRGVAMWPRDAADFVMAHRNRKAAQLEGEKAAELSSVVRCIGACIEHDGDLAGAARMRALVKVLDRAAGPEWAMQWSPQHIAADDRQLASIYVQCREVIRDLRRLKMRGPHKRELVDMLSGHLRDLLDFNNPSGLKTTDDFKPVRI